MNINISVAEAGAIICAIQKQYKEGTEEYDIATTLNKKVHDYFFSTLKQPMAEEFYKEWIKEFDICESYILQE